MTLLLKKYFNNIVLFALLFAAVLIINQPIISYNMIYQEQATIYLANQTIHSWQDLLNIYLHPRFLHMNIPFFRPSGHFLIYQLLMPLFGWHNMLALYVISFTFLTAIGFFMMKIYKLLFPHYYMGGLIAFGLYLMHPALSISRLTFMHFDFAYVACLLFSLYVFILFCKSSPPATRYLFLSLLLYALAITFKESAIMLGPVLACYYCLYSYKRMPKKTSLMILCVITMTSVLLGSYLISSWPSLHFAHTRFNIMHTLATANVMIKDIFAVNTNFIPFGWLSYEHYAWRTIVFTPLSRYVIWIFFWLMLATCMFSPYKKSLLFLFISCVLFSVLPLSWGAGGPWHHSLTLVSLSMMMGCSAEYFLRRIPFLQKYITVCCVLIFMILGIIGITIHFENAIKYNLAPNGFLGTSLNRNAILSPPDIKNQLNNDSIIVVEDSTLLNDYFMGNAAYPFILFFTDSDYENFKRNQQDFFLTFHPVYGGNLFRYAYLMPSLKEELYPFIIERMDNIPNEMIYNWLKHINNIFCLGYDSRGNWYDKTTQFKIFLMKEQAKRQLVIHRYKAGYPNNLIKIKKLPYSDGMLCAYFCDQNASCRGFILKNNQCYFYGNIMT